MQPDRPLLILICGLYTSGTAGDVEKIAANGEPLESFVLPIYELPMVGEFLAIIHGASGTNRITSVPNDQARPI